ncbi:hypothetical protein DSUL_80049 [Desulfovibrionales bacterium]
MFGRADFFAVTIQVDLDQCKMRNSQVIIDRKCFGRKQLFFYVLKDPDHWIQLLCFVSLTRISVSRLQGH